MAQWTGFTYQVEKCKRIVLGSEKKIEKLLIPHSDMQINIDQEDNLSEKMVAI